MQRDDAGRFYTTCMVSWKSVKLPYASDRNRVQVGTSGPAVETRCYAPAEHSDIFLPSCQATIDAHGHLAQYCIPVDKVRERERESV